MAYYSRDDLQNRPGAVPRPAVNTTKRSWQTGGLHFTMETTSYSLPGASFGSFSTSANPPSRNISAPNQTTSRRSTGGVLGTTFGILSDFLASQQAPQQQGSERGSSRRGSKQPHVDTIPCEDEDDGPGSNGMASEPRNPFVKLAERYINSTNTNTNTNTNHRTRKDPRSREHSPARQASRKSNRGSRSSLPKSEEQRPSFSSRHTSYAQDVTDDEYVEDDESDETDSDSSSGRRSWNNVPTNEDPSIKALEKAAEHHRKEIKSCKKRLEQASRRPDVNAAVLQHMVSELKNHERTHAVVIRELEKAKAKAGKRSSHSSRRAPHRARPSQSRGFPQMPNDIFGNMFGTDDFQAFFRSTQPAHPHFADFDDFHSFHSFPPSGGHSFTAFERLFNNANAMPGFGNAFFGVPRPAFTGAPRPRPGFSRPNFSQTQSPPIFPTPKPPPQPPANLLKPEEAKQCFQTYNARWNALAPTDPNIPYPCRGLQSRGLNARDTIWAPYVTSHISTWSEDCVMQANAQAFFLGVVGLAPMYTEAPGTGKIVMGYDKGRASPEQVRELVDLLKKEKIRWHSDRLGRRTGGVVIATGPNEALQRDANARAVFHAVCELMEATQ